MSKYNKDEFEKAAMPLIKYLNNGVFNPHLKVIVTSISAELLSGELSIHTTEFVKD